MVWARRYRVPALWRQAAPAAQSHTRPPRDPMRRPEPHDVAAGRRLPQHAAAVPAAAVPVGRRQGRGTRVTLRPNRPRTSSRCLMLHSASLAAEAATPASLPGAIRRHQAAGERAGTTMPPVLQRCAPVRRRSIGGPEGAQAADPAIWLSPLRRQAGTGRSGRRIRHPFRSKALARAPSLRGCRGRMTTTVFHVLLLPRQTRRSAPPR